MAALRSADPNLPIVAAALQREWEIREHPSMEWWRRRRAHACMTCGEPHDACLCPRDRENHSDDGAEAWEPES